MENERSWGQDWSEELDDEYGEYDEDYGDDYDEESYTIACPACGEDVYEDAEQCPSCGEYIIASERYSGYAWRDRPLWWIVLGGAGVLAVLWMLLF